MDQELTYKWIQDRLRELNSGTLSEKDKTRLVEIAKDDPFVADALEGFHTHPDTEHSVHLDRLAKKINQTRRTRRRWLMPNLTVTAIAASVFLIIATYAVISRIENQPEEAVFVLVDPDSLKMSDSITSDIAMEIESREYAADEELKAESTASSRESKQSAPRPGTTNKKIQETPSPPASTADVKNKDIAVEKPTLAEHTETAQSAKSLQVEDDDAVLEDVASGAQPEMSRAKRDEGYYANQMDPAMMQQRVTGRVLDGIDGSPLIGAQVSVSYSNQLLLTDLEGNFEIFIPEPEAIVQIAYPGSVDSFVIVRQAEENILVALRPGAMMPTSKAPEANKKGPVQSTHKTISDSFLNFKHHVSSSSGLQLTVDPSSARRKVMVGFEIGNNGRPRNIKVLESSRDKTYDGEALRLIESGPDWVCLGGGYPCQRTYTFYFR